MAKREVAYTKEFLETVDERLAALTAAVARYRDGTYTQRTLAYILKTDTLTIVEMAQEVYDDLMKPPR